MSSSAAFSLAFLLAMALSSVASGAVEEDSCQDLESVDPCDMNELLDVEFGPCGVRVSIRRTSHVPSVTYDLAEDAKKYLIVMVDPDAPSRSDPEYRFWRHWVMLDISGSSLKSGTPQGTTLTEYNGPSPPPKSGPHRYQLFLFEQPHHFKSVKTLGNSSRGKWNLHDFVRKNHLCDMLRAGYEFISENE